MSLVRENDERLFMVDDFTVDVHVTYRHNYYNNCNYNIQLLFV